MDAIKSKERKTLQLWNNVIGLKMQTALLRDLNMPTWIFYTNTNEELLSGSEYLLSTDR